MEANKNEMKMMIAGLGNTFAADYNALLLQVDNQRKHEEKTGAELKKRMILRLVDHIVSALCRQEVVKRPPAGTLVHYH